MNLNKICENINYTLLQGDMNTEVCDIFYDSGKLTAGGMFVCLVGSVTDGHKYIPDAVSKGASVIVLENENAAQHLPESITVIKVSSARYSLALMSAAFFDYPAHKLTTIGITGTKGKTTTAYTLKAILEEAGKTPGVMGTIGTLIGGELIHSNNTTPESYEIHRNFAKMAEAGCDCVIMEVSSQGLKLNRTAGIMFDYGLFTNLSADHIGPNEHASMEEYITCKGLLFKQCRTGIINIDDMYAKDILEGHSCMIKTFSVQQQSALKNSDLMAKDIAFIRENNKLGISFNVAGCMNSHVKLYTPGIFSVYNALGAMLICRLMGIADEDILRGLTKVQVKGRVEILPTPDDYTVIIDFAHNEMSTQSVLETLLQYEPTRLICVFGCGGNRSKQRRYGMGEITGRMADLIVLTSDNPRNESVYDINADIKVGLAKTNGKYIEIIDRREAIEYCLVNAQPGDMIVLLGKGHEFYEEINGIKRHFDEHEAVAEILAKLAHNNE